MSLTGSPVEHSSVHYELRFLLATLALPLTCFLWRTCWIPSCGSCGYELNLSSCNRNTSKIGSKYGKAIKKGIISFLAVDESKFCQKEELCCKPYFSKSSLGIFQQRTKLMCRKCSNHIGYAYDDRGIIGKLKNVDYIPGNGSCSRKYSIKISSIQPSDECSYALLSL